MKKNTLLICMLSITLVLGLFLLTGCGTNQEESNSQENQVVDKTLVKINGLEFHLNKEASFKGINYIISEDFKKAEFDSYVQYNYYQEDNSNLLFFRVFYYENKETEYAISDLGLDSNITLTDGKTDNIEYKYYAEPRDDGGTIHFYFITKDSNTYVINFVSKYDIKDFENKALESLKF